MAGRFGMKAMKAMNAMVIKKTMKAMQTAVSKNPMRKSPAMKAKKAMRKPRKSTAMETTLRPAENLQAYVQRALERVISLSRLGHIEGEFTPLLLAELQPAATMVRRRVWQMNSMKGKLTLDGTVMQALEYVRDLTGMGYIESDMAPPLLSELESAASMVRRREWTAPRLRLAT